MIEVELPDGTVAEFPDGMPMEQIQEVLAKQFPRRQAPASSDPTKVRQILASDNMADLQTYAVNQGFPNAQAMMEDIAGGKFGIERPAFQGPSMSFGDEILAGIRKEPYNEALEKERAVLDYTRATRPVASNVAELGFGAGMAVPPVVKGMQGAKSFAGSLGRAAVAGAGIGGLAGAGAGEGLEDRGRSAAQGAVGGGVLGPVAYSAAYPVAKAVGWAVPVLARLGKRFTNMMGFGITKEGQKQGREYMERMLARHELTPEQAAAFLDDAEAKGVKLVTGDLTPEVVSYMTTLPSKGKILLREMLEERARLLGPRLEKKIRESLGASENVLRDVKDMRVQQTSQAALDYGKAYAAPIRMNSTLKELLERPSMKRGIAEAKLQAKEEARKLPKEPDLYDMKAWDTVKRGLDRAYGDLKRKRPSKARDILRTKKELIAELETQTGGEDGLYAVARRNYATTEEMTEAIEEGRRLSRIDPDEFVLQLEDMTDAQKQYFRYGAAKALIDKSRSGREGTALVNKILNNRKTEMVLEQAFPSPEEYARFKELMLLEARTSMTRNQLYGSQTAERLSGFGDITQQPTIGQELARDIAGKAHDKMSEAQADEIARILRANPVTLRQIYKSPERETMRAILEAARGAATMGPVGGI